MARNSLGALLVSLGLDASQFISGLTKSEYQAKKSADAIKKQFDGIGKDFATSIGRQLGGIFSVTGVVLWTKSVLDAAEAMQDLAEETGSSVEKLSKLANIAEVQGTSFDDFRGVVEKFAVTLGQLDKEGSKAAEILRILGVTSRDPATALEEAAKGFAKFGDSATKLAAIRELGGRNAVQFAGALKAMAENTGIAATRTAEQVRKADELRESLRLLSNQSQTLANTLLDAAVPAFNEFLARLIKVHEVAGSIPGVLAQIAISKPSGNLEATQRSIAETERQLKEVEERVGGIKDKISSAIGFDAKTLTDLLRKQLTILKFDEQRFLDELAKQNEFVVPPQKDTRPKFPDVSNRENAAREAELLAKRLVDQQVKILEQGVAAEKDILDARSAAIKDAYETGALSAQNAFALEQQARNEALTQTISFYDKQIAALEKYRASLKKGSEQVEVATQVESIQEKRANAIRDATKAEADADRERRARLIDYGAAIDEIRAKMKELAGDTAAAAKIRLDAQFSLINARAKSEGDVVTQRAVKELQQQGEAVAKLNDATRVYRGTLEDLEIARARIDIKQQTGALTDIQAIVQRQNLAREYIGELQRQIAVQEAIAANEMASGVEREAAIRAIQRMKVEVDALAASANELAQKFNDAFAGPFADALADAVTGTKSLKEAFNDMTRSIVHNITQIASKDIAQALFGGFGTSNAGGLSGIGGWFAKWFGGGFGGGHGPMGYPTSWFEGIGYGTASTPPLGPYPYANGTNWHPGGWAMVGERGPEIVNLPKGAQVIPNDVLRSKRAERATNVIINQSFAPGTDRRTIGQAAAATGKAVRRGMERYS